MPLPDERTEAEINALARNLLGNQVVYLEMVPPNEAMHVFMPLVFGGIASLLDGVPDDETDEFLSQLFIFETLDKAGPRAINGWPSFFSMQVWRRCDALKAFEKAKAAAELIGE